jgi:ABC-type glycerol-3-phosphate transport system substrate-binding protein
MYTFEEQMEEGKTKSGTISHVFLVKLKRADKNPHAGKKVLQIGVDGYIDSKLVDYIVKYNKDESHTARIIICNLYGDAYQAENEDATLKKIADATNKLYLDMMAGEGPDILLNFSSMSQFNNDSILMDLNTLVDGPNGLNRNEYFDNVLRAFEKNGKLYHIPVNFSITCYLANKDVVGDRTSWTFDEFMNVCNSLPDKMSPLDEIEKADLLENLMDANFSQLVDYNTKKVYFDTPEFKKMLEIANSYGVNDASGSSVIMPYTDDKYADYDYEDMIENDLLAMRQVNIDSFTSYASYASMRKGKVTFIGSPSYQQSGLSATANLTLAVSSTCSDKDSAWEFIRFLFSEEEQYSFTTWNMSIPVNRKALERKTETDIQWYNEMMTGFSDGPSEADNGDIVHYDFSKEAQAAFVKLIERVTQDYGFDTAISQIIKEDVAGYFSGQRTADDVCKSIQNRTQTIINERG